jgi:hypothetical protein
MLDTFYPALVSFVATALGLAPGLWPEKFKRWPYRIAAVICAILLGLGTYAVMEHERRTAESKAVKDREAAIQETSVRVASRTSASVSDVLGRLFAENVAEIRNMKKYTVGSAAEVHAIWQRDQTGEQKRQDVKEQLNRYIGMNTYVLGPCGNTSPPGRGGTSAESCLDSAREWKSMATGYISGSLGELYLHRFEQAGLRRNGEAPPTGVDVNLDPHTRSEVSWAIYELKEKANVLKEFISELSQ